MDSTNNNQLDILSEINDLSLLISWLDEKLENKQQDNHTSVDFLTIEDISVLNNSFIDQNLISELENISESINVSEEDNLPNKSVIELVESLEVENFCNEKTVNELTKPNDFIGKEILKLNKKRKHRKISVFLINQLKYLTNYAFVSTVVFFILLVASNYSAYSKIAYNYINPESLKTSSKEILNVIDNSRIQVFADEDNSNLGKNQQEEIQKNLAENNTQLRDTYFSPKKLVPLRSNLKMDIEITPYENRIMIPKLGKNIPLVDVDARWINPDFTNLENIFMRELNKWVVRYPGTAKPWENGNTFIFWHSSNYAWDDWEYNDVFALLDNLETWDEIIIYYNQKKLVYVINDKKVIKPWNIKVLDRDPNKKELTLMTCWPVWTTISRLVTFAELKTN